MTDETQTTEPKDVGSMSDEVPETVEYSTDDLFALEVDKEKAAKVEQELLLTAGWWRTVPAITFTHTERVIEEGPNKGVKRLTSRAFVKIQRIDKKTGEVAERGALPLAFSPLYLKNEKGAWDLQTRLILAARGAVGKMGGDNTSYGGIIRHLETYPMDVRVIRTKASERFDAGNIIVGLKAPKLDDGE